MVNKLSSPLLKQSLRCKVSTFVCFFWVISKFGLDSIGGQQHSCLWGAVYLVGQNGILHLHEEQLFSDVLNEFFSHIFWVVLGPELKLKRVLLLHLLRGHLEIRTQNDVWNILIDCGSLVKHVIYCTLYLSLYTTFSASCGFVKRICQYLQIESKDFVVHGMII